MVGHVAIIMDGNRRFSRRLLKNPFKGHEWGYEKLKEVLLWAKEAGVRELTLYAFSLQNFDRPKKEFDHLMKLFISACDELLEKEDLAGKGVRVRFVGEIDRFPAEVSSRMKRLMALTKDNSDYFLNLAVAYGGREEIVSSLQKAALRVSKGELSADDIGMGTVTEGLYVQSEPDLVIRTGGERRTSNFLLWQTWYSEWFFVDSLWPEFSKEEFLNCLEEFSSRQRRFGR